MQFDDSASENQATENSALAVAAQTPVLEMRSVSLRQERRDARLRRVSFQLNAGEIVLVRRPPGESKQLLASAALGLVKPKRGEVLVDGKNWNDVRYRQRLEMRSRIGRVFDTGGWLIGLTVLNNIMLSERHHRNVDDDLLRQQVFDMLRRFRVALPTDPPAYVEAWKLKICQWTRALLGNPDLLVLERPFFGVTDKHRNPFYETEREFRASGGATLWITDSPSVWENPKLKDAKRFVIQEQSFVPCSWEEQQ